MCRSVTATSITEAKDSLAAVKVRLVSAFCLPKTVLAGLACMASSRGLVTSQGGLRLCAHVCLKLSPCPPPPIIEQQWLLHDVVIFLLSLEGLIQVI